MKSVLARLSILIAFLSSTLSLTVALAAPQDGFEYASAQTAFENRMINRLEMVLLPTLGKDNFSINLGVKTKAVSSARSSDDIYFSKLGFAARITGNEPYRYEDDITDLAIDVSISDKVKGYNEEDLKKRLTATAKAALPQLKKEAVVTVETFTPVKAATAEADARIWTPIALVLCAALIVFGLITSAKRISKINFSIGGGADSSRASSVANIFEPKESKNADRRPAIEKFEGIQKWAQWTNEDLPSACNFVEKLSRSEEESDLALLAYIFHASNLNSTKKMLGGLRKDTLNKVKKVTEYELKSESFIELDAALTQHITQHFVYQTLDSEHLLQYIHDFTIDEAVYITSQQPSMLELFMKYYSTPQMEQIMGWVSYEALNNFLKTRSVTQFNLNAMAKQAQQMVFDRRLAEERKSDSSVAKWLEVASQLDSARELAFYKSLVSDSAAQDLHSIAMENFPQFLIEQLPEKILKPSLNSYPLEERADYLFTLPKELRAHYMAFFKSEPRVLEVLEIEIEQIAADIARRAVIENRKDTIAKDFNHRIRKYIRSSPENQQVATDLFNKWVAEARRQDAKPSSAA